MKKYFISIFILLISYGLFSQNNYSSYVKNADTVNRIVGIDKTSGKAKYGLKVGNDTAWMVWDGSVLNFVADTLKHNGSPIGADFTLTTTGTSGPSTYTGGVLNIPVYSSGSGGSSPWRDEYGMLFYPPGFNNITALMSPDDSIVGIEKPYFGDIQRKSLAGYDVYNLLAIKLQPNNFRMVANKYYEINSSWFRANQDSINAYIAAYPEVNGLVIDTITTMTANWTLPADVKVTRSGNGMIKGAFTIDGNSAQIAIGREQLFSSEVTVKQGSFISANGVYPPEWFGAKNDSTVNSTVAFRKTLRAFKQIDILSGHYQITDSIHIYRYDIVNADYQTKIWWNQTGNTNSLFEIIATPCELRGNGASIYIDKYGCEGSMIHASDGVAGTGYPNHVREGGSTSPYIDGTAVGRYGFYIGGWNFKGFNWIAPAFTAYASNDVIKISNTSVYASGFVQDLEPIRLKKGSGSLPTGLDQQKVYYTIYRSDTSFQLATSKANAIADIAVNFTSNGSAGNSVNIFTNESPNGIVLTQKVGSDLYFATIENMYMQKMDTMLKVYSQSTAAPMNGWHYHNITFDTPINTGLVIGDPRFLGNNHENIFSNIIFQQSRPWTMAYFYEPANVIQGTFFDCTGDSAFIFRAGNNINQVTNVESTNIRDFSTGNLHAFSDDDNGKSVFSRNTTTGLWTKVAKLGESSGSPTIDFYTTAFDIRYNGSSQFQFRNGELRPRDNLSSKLGSSGYRFSQAYFKNFIDDGTNAIAYGQFKVDTIVEKDANSGVLIDGVLLKDSGATLNGKFTYGDNVYGLATYTGGGYTLATSSGGARQQVINLSLSNNKNCSISSSKITLAKTGIMDIQGSITIKNASATCSTFTIVAELYNSSDTKLSEVTVGEPEHCTTGGLTIPINTTFNSTNANNYIVLKIAGSAAVDITVKNVMLKISKIDE